MKKILLLFVIGLLTKRVSAQNVGIGTQTPIDKLNIDSGNIRIGKAEWLNATHSKFLKFGDGNYLTLGEEEDDDKLTIRAKELLIRPSSAYNTVPLTFQGSSNFSHFYFGPNEDTYIRGGKSSSNLILGDGGGRTGINVYPQRAMLEQNGSIGTTAAIFGGDGSGISLQKNWPAIGFNHYYDGTNRAIGTGRVAQMGLDQGNGNIYFSIWPNTYGVNAAIADVPVTKIFISRTGRIGVGTDDPQSDIEIRQNGANTASTPDASNGLRLTNPYTNSSWTIRSGAGFILNDFFSFVFNGTFKATINNSDGSYSSVSDRSLKTDIRPLGNTVLNKISLLNPCSYYMISDTGRIKRGFGFIAQEVEKLFPELVVPIGDKIGMTYQYFIPILTKGMQEQQQQIETLQNENAELKARLEKLEKIILKQSS